MSDDVLTPLELARDTLAQVQATRPITRADRETKAANLRQIRAWIAEQEAAEHPSTS